jgi:hypothetical protein
MANPKRGLRLMRDDHVLCLRNKGFVRTTNAQPRFAGYPHLIPELTRRALTPLWVADMTDVRRQREVIDVAVILEA